MQKNSIRTKKKKRKEKKKEKEKQKGKWSRDIFMAKHDNKLSEHFNCRFFSRLVAFPVRKLKNGL